MAVDPDLVDQITSTIADLYREAETALIRTVAQRLRQDPPLPSPYQETKLEAVQALRRSAQAILAAVQAARTEVVRQAVADAYRHGQGAALADLPERWFPRSGIGQAARTAIAEQLPNAAVIENLAAALHADLGRVDGNILRAPMDAYRAVQAGTAARIATGSYTRLEASQAAWQQLVNKGIVTFTDRAGRVWRLSSYVEMIARTNIARAAIQGQTDRLTSIGMDLVIVSNAPQECKLCRPFEGKILAISGPTGKVQVEHATRDGVMVTVDVLDTLDGARAKGFQHPNAILGDQGCRVLGQIENVARAWYDGPSVHLTTARGHRLTVSPNHPVLTSLGWLAADRIREGMHVFSATDREGVDAASGSVEDLDNVPASFEQVFDALAAHGLRTRVAVAADDFHGDGRHYEGEVDVVWTERALLDALQPYSVEQLGEGCLVRPGVELQALAGGCSALAPVHGVASPVARSLSDFDAVRLEASSQRRVADAEDPSEVLAGLSCEVALDEVVNVDRDWYRGHAYDLQTSTGAYLTADIVVHNCRHSVSAYQAGITKIPTHTADPEGDKARQKQRALERKIRAAREQAAAALTDEARKAANAKVRAAQAELRAHLEAHPTLKRLRYREQIGAGNIPKKPGGPSGGPVGDLQPPVQPTLDGGPAPRPGATTVPEPPARPAAPARGQLTLDDAQTVRRDEPTVRQRTAEQPPARPEVPAAARPYHRTLDGIEDLAAAVRRAGDGDGERTALSGGQSATTELVKLRDGTRLVRKKGMDWGDPDEVAASIRTQADAEHLTSLLGRAIGAPVARVYREAEDTVWLEWIDGDVIGARPDARALVDGRDGKLLGLLDHLTAGADRNSGNIMVTPDGRLVGIDHGWSFGEHNLGERDPVIQDEPGRPAWHYSRDGRWVDNPLTQQDVAELRARLAELREDFTLVGRGAWLDHAMMVLDQLAQHAKGTENLIA